MKSCTFFGHRDCPETIKPKIHTAVVDLIENHGVTMFYVGNQGNFDRMVRSVLKEVTTGALQNRHLQRALFVGKIDCGREECGKYGSKPCGIDIRNQTPAYLPASSVENIPLLRFTLSFSQTHGFSSVRVPASSTTFSGQTPWPAGTTRRGCSPCPG